MPTSLNDTGWLFAGTISSHLAPTSNLGADDGNYATYTFPGSVAEEQAVIQASNFGASIPAGAEIRGVEIQYECKASVAGEVYISINAFGRGSTNLQYSQDNVGDTIGTSDVVKTAGAAQYGRIGINEDQRWLTYNSTKHGIIRDNVNATNFIVQISFNTNTVSTATISVDYVRVKIHYWTAANIPFSTGPQVGRDVLEGADGDVSWNNLARVKSPGLISGTYADTPAMTAGQTTNTVFVHQLGIKAPKDATVLGIEAVVHWFHELDFPFGDKGVGSITTCRLTKNSAGSPAAVGNNKASAELDSNKLGFSYEGHLFGGEEDLWGTTWSVADVEHENFGIALQFDMDSVLSGSPTIRLHYVTVRVYWSGYGGQVTSWTMCGTGASSTLVAGDAWVNPGNITADDTSYASRTGANDSQLLRASNFGFSLNATSIIDGIEVRYHRINAGGSSKQRHAQLVNASAALAGDNQANLPADGSAYEAISAVAKPRTIGGLGMLWGATWTATNINDTDFGFGLSVDHTNAGDDIDVDFVEIRIWWSAGAVEKSNSDTLTVGAGTENSSKVRTFLALTSSDTPTLTLIEEEGTQRTFRAISESDPLTIALNEVAQTLRTFLDLSETDTLTVNLSEIEEAAIFSTIAESDTLTLALIELNSLFDGSGSHSVLVRYDDDVILEIQKDRTTLTIRADRTTMKVGKD